jgi:hypothetical protein
MADDYNPKGIPPHWPLDMAADEAGYAPASLWRAPKNWRIAPLAFRALAMRIWRTEQPPVDPDMPAMREAIAAYEVECGRPNFAGTVRGGAVDTQVTTAIVSLRKSGVLK